MRDQFRDQDFRDYLPEFAPYADIVWAHHQFKDATID
jgi:hypothetical protein